MRGDARRNSEETKTADTFDECQHVLIEYEFAYVIPGATFAVAAMYFDYGRSQQGKIAFF